ncbi:MAG: hypothetical protein ACKVP5_08735 [Aestuariivirga sp.]
MKRRLVLVLVAGLLAGCGTEKPAVRTAEPFHIAQVEAVGPLPQGVSEWQLDDLGRQTQALAGLVPETGNPRLLRLRIAKFHQKNPGMSFLVGDSNNMTVSGEVLHPDNGGSLGTFTVRVSTDVCLNGIIGTAIAANTQHHEAAGRLNVEAGSAILEKIYGTKAWKAWTRRRR